MAFSSCLVLANDVPRISVMSWLWQHIGGYGVLFSALAALAIFIGAVRLVRQNCPPGAFAAYLVLLPLPPAIFICDFIKRVVSSLMVLSLSPEIQTTRSDVTAATSADLASLLLVLLMTAPTYVVLTYGLLTRTMNSTQEPNSAANAIGQLWLDRLTRFRQFRNLTYSLADPKVASSHRMSLARQQIGGANARTRISRATCRRFVRP